MESEKAAPKSSRGRNNKLAAQIGEFLVCAELGRRGWIATPFSGNVPTFDVLAADLQCRTVPLQVKASRGDSWPTHAKLWMDIELDEVTGTQKLLKPHAIANPDLIYVHVAIAEGENEKDRFFILTKAELQRVVISGYTEWMEKHNWRRPRTPGSFDARYRVPQIKKYESKWELIIDRLKRSKPDLSLDSTQESELTENAVDEIE